MSWEDIGFDFDRVGTKAYDDYNSPKLTVKTSAAMNNSLVSTFIGVDLSERKPDWSSLGIIDTKSKTIESRIIRTDNPKPDFWLKKFLENEKETKEQEPSDENGREHDLRNAEKDNCV